MDEEKKKKLEAAGWRVGDADEFLGKTKRMKKIEEWWAEQHRVVEFEESDAGYWHVYVKGFFADFEICEIANALKAANKDGKL